MRVERVTPAHLAQIAELERLCFHAPWSERALELLCGDTATGFVALEGEAVVAYGGMLCVLDEGQITNVATHPAHRRQGFADAVLRALLREAAARGLSFVTLEVRESNAPAIALYRRHGFAAVGRRPHFYKNPDEAALLLQWNAPAVGTNGD